MNRRLFEAFFRHRWIVLLPVMLIPLAVTPFAVLRNPPQYEAGALVWVEDPAYLKYANKPERYTTAAQDQQSRLTELLRTRAFQRDVAQRTSLAPLLADPKGEDHLDREIGKAVSAVTNGERLLAIKAQSVSATTAAEVVQAVLAAYLDRVTAERAQHAQVAIQFYEGQLRAPADQATADRAREGLSQARYDFAVAQQGQALGFQLLDAPEVPTERTRLITKGAVVAAIVSVVTGVTLGGALLWLIMRLDDAVRSADDLLGGVPVIGALPSMQGLADIHLQRLAR